MHLSRRSFVKAATVSGVGALTAPLIAARGSEALRGPELEPHLWSTTTGAFASDSRTAYRIGAPEAIRLDSNENPNGPGKAALEAVRAMFTEAPRYPDVPTVELTQAIARHFKLTADNVQVGCGSGEKVEADPPAVLTFASAQLHLIAGADTVRLLAELATSPEQHRLGLMERHHLADTRRIEIAVHLQERQQLRLHRVRNASPLHSNWATRP